MILITVFRTIFYQFFILFIGLSIGFIINAEYIGWRSPIVNKSVKNIFFPTEFTEEVCQQVKNWGKFRIFAFNDRPENFTVIEDGLLAEEFYIAKFTYTDDKGNTLEKIDKTRVRWKSWEYYYTGECTWTEKDLEDYKNDGTLNSIESDKFYKLLFELNNQNNHIKKEEKNEYQNDSTITSRYTNFKS